MHTLVVSFVVHRDSGNPEDLACKQTAHSVRGLLESHHLDFHELTVLPAHIVAKHLNLGAKIPCTEAELSHEAFAAYHKPLNVWCLFMAENIHHAGNKALKLWGGEYVRVMDFTETQMHMGKSISHTRFTALVKAWNQT